MRLEMLAQIRLLTLSISSFNLWFFGFFSYYFYMTGWTEAQYFLSKLSYLQLFFVLTLQKVFRDNIMEIILQSKNNKSYFLNIFHFISPFTSVSQYILSLKIDILKIQLKMGNTANTQQIFNKEQWVQATYSNTLFPNVNPYRIKILMNITNSQVVQEYIVRFVGEEDYTEYMRHLDWRRSGQSISRKNHSKNMTMAMNPDGKVSNDQFEEQITSRAFIYPIEYFIDTSENQFCTVVYSGIAYIKKVEVRLKDINDIPVDDSIYLYYACLKGFCALYEKIGTFQVEEEMIFIDRNGLVRVWMNRNLSKNYPEVSTEPYSQIQKSRKNIPKSNKTNQKSTIPQNFNLIQPQYLKNTLEMTNLKSETFSQNHCLSQADMVSNIIALVEDNIDPLTISNPLFSDYLAGKAILHRLSFDKALEELQNFIELGKLKRNDCMLSIADLYRDTRDQSPSRASQNYQNQSIDAKNLGNVGNVGNNEKQKNKKSRNQRGQIDSQNSINLNQNYTNHNQKSEITELNKSNIQRSLNSVSYVAQQRGRMSQENVRKNTPINGRFIASGTHLKTYESIPASQRKISGPKSSISQNNQPIAVTVPHNLMNYNLFDPFADPQRYGVAFENNATFFNNQSGYQRYIKAGNQPKQQLIKLPNNAKNLVRINYNYQNPNGFKKPQSFHQQRQKRQNQRRIQQSENYNINRGENSFSNQNPQRAIQNIQFARQRHGDNPMSKSYHHQGQKRGANYINLNEMIYQMDSSQPLVINSSRNQYQTHHQYQNQQYQHQQYQHQQYQQLQYQQQQYPSQNQSKNQESSMSFQKNVYIDSKKVDIGQIQVQLQEQPQIQQKTYPNLENTIKKPIKLEKGFSPISQMGYNQNSKNNQHKILFDYRAPENLQNTKSNLNQGQKTHIDYEKKRRENSNMPTNLNLNLNLNYQMPKSLPVVVQSRLSNRNYFANVNKNLEDSKRKQNTAYYINQGQYQLDEQIANDLQNFMKSQGQSN